MRGERGFTLVEVLVVMVVLALGILGSLQALLIAERLQVRGRAQTRAVFLAQDRIERIGALGWERATEGLELRAPAGLTGSHEAVPSEELVLRGVRYLVVSAREAALPGPPDCVVTCFWAKDGRPFERRNAVRLRGPGG